MLKIVEAGMQYFLDCAHCRACLSTLVIQNAGQHHQSGRISTPLNSKSNDMLKIMAFFREEYQMRITKFFFLVAIVGLLLYGALRYQSINARAFSQPKASSADRATAFLSNRVQTTPTPVVVIPYGSTGIKYQVVAWGASSGFEQPGFDDSGFLLGDAPFGTGGAGCLADGLIRTPWPINTDILVRKEFVLPTGSHDVKVGVAIDNDMQVFINGQGISGLQLHALCPQQGDYIFPVPDGLLHAGSNLIAMRGHDWGVASFLDFQITATVGTLQPPAVALGATINQGCVNPSSTTTVFYTNTISVSYTGGQVILASTADGLGNISTDDEVRIDVNRPDGTAATFSYVFGYPKHTDFIETLPPQDVTNLFQVGINAVTIQYVDNSICARSSFYYLSGVGIPPSCLTPSIITQPSNQTIASDQRATLSVIATGATPLTYQWYRGTSGDSARPITGAISNSYTTPPLKNTTSYWVQVSNACGAVNSSTAAITVVPILVSDGFDYPVSNIYRPTRDVGDSDGWFATNSFCNYLVNTPCSRHIHPGDDWNKNDENDVGEPVKAVSHGKIIAIKELKNAAKQPLGDGIVIEHLLPGGAIAYSVYIHVVADKSLKDKPVHRGDTIAKIASIKGISPHLHFEIRSAFNLQDWYPNDDGCGYYDSCQIIISLGFVDPVVFIDHRRP